MGVENAITSSSRCDVTIEALVDFGPGNDLLIGDRSSNDLKGNRGPDRILGAKGSDRLSGGPGGDRIRAADGERDTVRCGSGPDLAIIDPGLDRWKGCESVRDPGTP